MALVAKLDASTGNITCGTVDGVTLATLYAAVRSHDHVLSGYTGYYEPVMTLYDSAGGTTFQIGDSGGSGSTGRVATATDKHRHAAAGSPPLASDVETLGAAGSAKTDDTITIDSATGDVVCDLINTIAPEVLYAEFDDHYHSMMGSPADYELAALRPKNSTTYKYFHTASDSSGTDPHWEEVTTNKGTHGHAIGNLSLAAYDAGSGGGSGDAGEPKFAIRSATGNLETKRDVNGIDVSAFWTKYLAHILHAVTGATVNAAQSNAQVHGVTTGDFYVEATSGVWRLAYVRRLAHSHSGSGIIVATPS